MFHIVWNFVYSPHETLPTCRGLITFPEPALTQPPAQPEGAVRSVTAGSAGLAKAPPRIRIPRIIHVFEKLSQSPGERAVAKYADEERDRVMFFNYTTVKWNVTGLRDWMGSAYAWYVPLLDALTDEQKAQVAPYFILDAFGGIMLSPRYFPHVDLYPYLAPDRVNFLETNMPLWEPVSTSLIASANRHPFWPLIHRRLLEGPAAVGSHLMGEMGGKYPFMSHVLSCMNFNRIHERSTGHIKKHTNLRRKCGLDTDPCLYGSLEEA